MCWEGEEVMVSSGKRSRPLAMLPSPLLGDGNERQVTENLEPIEIAAFFYGDESDQGGEGRFHTLNNPKDPYQRDNIIERQGRVDVRCEHKDIVHGFFSEANDDPCTLIVLGFRFQPNGLAHRIKQAKVVIRFASMAQGGDDPEVVRMWPDGQFSFHPTSQHETILKGGGISISAGADAIGLSLGGELKQEHTVDRDTTDATWLRGSIDLRGRNWGPKNSVSWTLWENRVSRTGVLPSMPAAILLRRSDMHPFKATITIEIVADRRTALSSVFKSDPQDDDIWYDPQRNPPSTDRLRKYDVDNLGGVMLSEIAGVPSA